MRAKVDKYLLIPDCNKRYLYFGLNKTDNLGKIIHDRHIKLEFDCKTKKYIFKYKGSVICHM